MKRLCWLLGILVIAAAIGVSLHRHPGVIVVAVDPWRIDIPLWLAVLAIVIMLMVMQWVVKLLAAIWHIGHNLAQFGRHYRRHRAKALTQRGLIALAEGNYSVAKKALSQSADDSETPWYNYFCAAQAAQKLGEENTAREWWGVTQKEAPATQAAIRLTQAHYALEQAQYTRALTILQPHLEGWHDNHKALNYLQQAYYGAGDWAKLVDLLPLLKKQRVLAKEKYQTLERDVWKKTLLESKKLHWTESRAIWKTLSSRLQLDSELVLTYVKILMTHKQAVEAEPLLRASIKHHWNDDVVRCYGQLDHPQPQKLLQHAENWLEQHPQNAVLMLTLGRLCVRQALWGKAQRYFEASISLTPSAAAYAELASLFERIQKPQLSEQYFKKGLLSITSTTPTSASLTYEGDE